MKNWHPRVSRIEDRLEGFKRMIEQQCVLSPKQLSGLLGIPLDADAPQPRRQRIAFLEPPHPALMELPIHRPIADVPALGG